MEMEWVDEQRLTERLSMAAAIEALDRAFRSEHAEAPPRQHLDVGSGDLLLMPAWSDGGVGVKLVTVAPGNPDRGASLINGVYVLFDGATLVPKLFFDAAPLTGLRTAAVSGLATKYLARPEASRLVVFGAGAQARWHIRAMRAVRQIESIVVVSRTPERAHALVAEAPSDVGISVGEPSSVKDADVVCCCTTSPDPLFDGTLLAPGAHVNAVGSYKPTARELDDATMARADVIVESRKAALSEAGDIVLAIDHGAMTADDIVADLTELVRGSYTRPDDPSVTVFKSVGSAFEDLTVALAAAQWPLA